MKAFLAKILETYADSRDVHSVVARHFEGKGQDEPLPSTNQTLAAVYVISCIDYSLPAYKTEGITFKTDVETEISVSISKNEIKDYAAIVIGTNSIYLDRGPNVDIGGDELVDLINHVWLNFLRINNDYETR